MKILEKTPVNAATSPFLGSYFFFTHPFLWKLPLFFSFCVWVVLFGIFSIVLYWRWPAIQPLPINYLWGILTAICYALIVILLIWVFLFPILLNFAFKKMLFAFLKEKYQHFIEKDISIVHEGFYLLYKTMLWRFGWLVSSFIAAAIAPPISVLIAITGFAHIAIVDAIDLTLALIGFSDEERIAIIRTRDAWILLSGVVGGILTLILLPTLIGWIFWLPSMYMGAALWCLKWDIGSPLKEI